MDARRFDEERVNEEVHPKVEQVPQGGQGFKGAKNSQLPPQGDSIPWKELLRFWRCLIGRLERL